MFGFAVFLMIVVVGILTLVGGLQLISGRKEQALPDRNDPRLDRMESALTSLEARLDDLQEQQRFLERLLEQRPSGKALGAGSGEEDAGDDPSTGVDSILFDTEEES